MINIQSVPGVVLDRVFVLAGSLSFFLRVIFKIGSFCIVICPNLSPEESVVLRWFAESPCHEGFVPEGLYVLVTHHWDWPGTRGWSSRWHVVKERARCARVAVRRGENLWCWTDVLAGCPSLDLAAV